VFLSVQKHFFLVTNIWLESSASDPKLTEEKWFLRKLRHVCPPSLFVGHNAGQVLLRRARGNRKDAEHRLFVRRHRMQRQCAIHRFITGRDSISNSVEEKET
jgi:hypothetical protein